jgi:hypothetical protein
MKKNEVDRINITLGGNRKCMKILVGQPQRKEEMGILGVGRRIRSSCILRKNCYEVSEVIEFCYFRLGYSLR